MSSPQPQSVPDTFTEPPPGPQWDDPTVCPSAFVFKARELLKALVLMSEAPAGAIASEDATAEAGSAHVKPSGSAPPKVSDTAGKLAKEWQGATTNRRRLRLLWEMQRALEEARYSPSRDRVRGTLDWKIAVATDERTASVVGHVYGISARQVRTYRAAHRAGTLARSPK